MKNYQLTNFTDPCMCKEVGARNACHMHSPKAGMWYLSLMLCSSNNGDQAKEWMPAWTIHITLVRLLQPCYDTLFTFVCYPLCFSLKLSCSLIPAPQTLFPRLRLYGTLYPYALFLPLDILWYSPTFYEYVITCLSLSHAYQFHMLTNITCIPLSHAFSLLYS